MRALFFSFLALVVIFLVAAGVAYYFRTRCLVIFGIAPLPPADADVPAKQAPGPSRDVSTPAASGAAGGAASSLAYGQVRAASQPMIVVATDERGRGEVMQYAVLAKACDGWSESRILGKGGAATVYQAEVARYGALAVKRLHPGSERGRDFRREIDALALCRHPSILEIVGCASDGPEALIVTPLMEGGAFGQAMPSMRWSRRSVIAGQITRAVAFLHGKDILHRDIKSSNILLDRSRRLARLADFGLAKQSAHAGAGTTGVVVGSPGYMAPELLMRVANAKTDSFALGVVLLETLTGLPAWDLEEGLALTDRVIEAEADGSPHFRIALLEPRAAWPEAEGVLVGWQASNMTLFDPARRTTAVALECDTAYVEHLRRADADDPAPSQPDAGSRSGPLLPSPAPMRLGAMGS